MTGWDVGEYAAREVLDAAPIAVTIHDRTRSDDPVVYANDRFLSLTGYDRETVLGASLDLLAGPESGAKPLGRVAAALGGDEPATAVVRATRADGSTFRNRVRAAALPDGSALLVHADAGETLATVDLVTASEACWRGVATGGADLSVQTDQRIRADPDRLKQLLSNLFRNAVEHGDAWHVTLGELPDEGFYVRDDGSGIPEDERQSVFESGYTTAEDGMGFGLTVCRQIADFHGWELAIAESPTGGTRFEITGVERV